MQSPGGAHGLRRSLICSKVEIGSMRRQSCTYIGLTIGVLGVMACADKPQQPKASEAAPPAQPPAPLTPPTLAPEALEHPVPLWEGGKVTGEIDAATATAKGFVVVDLGEAWTPYIFTEGVSPLTGKPLANAYREVYLQLARGEFPDNYHGDRAREDKYLELYGIMPSLHTLRGRIQRMSKLECAKHLDLSALVDFKGLVVHESNTRAQRVAREYGKHRRKVAAIMKRQRVARAALIKPERLKGRDRDMLRRYLAVAAEYEAVDATQKLLKCEGFFGKNSYVRGALDWNTRQALAEFERRHRVYSWGFLGKDTLAMLRVPAMEAERQSVVRIMTERAIHASTVLEDGSTGSMTDGQPRTFQGKDGKQHPIPNLALEIQHALVEAFGLQTPESTQAWLVGLGPLPKDQHHFAAFRGPAIPEYYNGDMQLTLTYDRGDVWYDFPYDAQGHELPQPVQRRPNVTVSTRYLDQNIPLARFGTTIGGWRHEWVGDTSMWKYKESPVGERVWTEIVASPVWLPPDSTPPKSLLKRKKKPKFLEPPYEVNYYETGPGYASAYGLVAAYHKKFNEGPDETIFLGNDEGIRTHGSVDYMSIMRRHSHGCHRLHNHIAVRLMSWVLAHRPHTRKGQVPLAFKKILIHEELTYDLELKQGGYVFALATPLKIEVLEGRIRGKLKEPIKFAIPKYDEMVGAYLTPDGGAVELQGDKLVEIPLPPPPDGGVPDPALAQELPSDGELDYRPGPPPAPSSPILFAKPEFKPES
jgi:hypothetical protein